jgi:UDP-N-acetylmuramoyl-L-alanyl-D-glutamate--2,6-diaminopimelate ligase
MVYYSSYANCSSFLLQELSLPTYPNLGCEASLLKNKFNSINTNNIKNSGLDFDEIVEILPKIKAPKGRLDRIEDSNIFIDYAHSPESLEFTIKELIKLKPTKKSRLITLFGCGGDRDKSKRPIMGSIAANLSDIVIVTDDNPRNEDPRLIRADILSSINGRENITEISGREKAIKKAIEIMDKDDILLIAGKGHEKFQLIKGEKFEFDEFKIVKEYLK